MTFHYFPIMKMKRILTFLLLVLVMVPGIEARTFVLACGISNYRDEEANVPQPSLDAKRFKEVMQSQTNDITLLTSKNVTRANVLEKLRAICNRAGKDDRIVFFYSGHGMPGALYLFNGDTLSYDDLIEALSDTEARVKMCFINACHSGSAGEAKVNGNVDWSKSVSSVPGLAFLVSSRADEYSIGSNMPVASYFVQALVKGLRGKADSDHNKKITLMELFRYIHGDVLKRSENKQHPQMIAPKNMYDVVVTRW